MLQVIHSKGYKEEMQQNTTQENLLSNLTSVVLNIKYLAINDLAYFGFIYLSAPERLIRALELLTSSGALNNDKI